MVCIGKRCLAEARAEFAVLYGRGNSGCPREHPPLRPMADRRAHTTPTLAVALVARLDRRRSRERVPCASCSDDDDSLFEERACRIVVGIALNCSASDNRTQTEPNPKPFQAGCHVIARSVRLTTCRSAAARSAVRLQRHVMQRPPTRAHSRTRSLVHAVARWAPPELLRRANRAAPSRASCVVRRSAGMPRSLVIEPV